MPELRERRERAGLSVEELAARAGVTAASLEALENGDASALGEYAKGRLAALVGVEPARLYPRPYAGGPNDRADAPGTVIRHGRAGSWA